MTDNGGDVCVVGCGAQTSIGRSAPESAASVRAGISRIGEHAYMVDRAGELMVVARAGYVSEEVRGVERFVELGVPAAREALAVLGESVAGLSVPMIVGLPAERPGLPAGFASEMANRLVTGIEGPCRVSSVEMYCCGHSAGLMAIEEGSRRIRSGEAELCLVGGIDSYLEPETLEWLDFEDQLHSTRNKWGFIPGEAAGFCLLASRRAARERGLRVSGHVVAAATTLEANLIKTDSVCLGEALTAAFRRVLEGLAPAGRKIDQIVCDLNGERYRTDEYGYTVTRTSQFFVDASDFLTPADCWGDVGAASGPLFVILAVGSAANGSARGQHTLVWTSSESGERSAVVLHHVVAE